MSKSLDRREAIKLLKLAAAVSAAPAMFRAPDKKYQGAKPKNVMVIVFDAWSARHISTYGYPRITTPNLNRLLDQAAVYHNHIAGGNFTKPGTASLLTGAHVWEHRAFRMAAKINSFYESHNIFTLFDEHYRIAYTHNPIANSHLIQLNDSIDRVENIQNLYLRPNSLSSRFSNDFDASEDVTLVVKAFSYHEHLDWINEILRASQKGENTPEIIFEHGGADSIEGYYTAADWGVYPYRGEGFGLTILESMACGCPVIVTQGGSTDDFCDPQLNKFIKATPAKQGSKNFLLPDKNDLKRLMREAFEQGKLSDETKQKVHQSVSGFTWKDTAQKWDATLQEWAGKNHKTPPPADLERKELATIVYDFDESISPWTELLSKGRRFGAVSPWKHSLLEIVRQFQINGIDPHYIFFSDEGQRNIYEYILGEAGFALEYFRAQKELNNDIVTILFHDRFPVNIGQEIELQERARCGVDYDEFPPYYPLLEWRYNQELKVTDHFMFLDSVASSSFAKHTPTARTHNITPPISGNRNFSTRTRDKTRILFWGHDPFRKGVRPLLEGWDMVKRDDVELVCVFDSKLVLSSKQLLKYFVKARNMEIHTEVTEDRAMALLENCDFQIIPAIADGFFLPAAKGMSIGKPAIVTENSGLKDIIVSNETGIIIDQPTPQTIAAQIERVCDMTIQELEEMSEACYLHAQQFSRRKFAEDFIRIIMAIMDK